MKSTLKPEPAVITAIKEQTGDTATYTIAFKDPKVQANYRFQPGQFNMLSLLGIGEAPISISSSPGRGDTFDHTVRVVGDLTRALAALKEGDLIGVRGPYGAGWPMEEAKGKDVLIVAGGIGLAPLRPAITHIFENRKDYGRLEILYGARTPGDMLFTDEFDDWCQNPDTHLLLTADTVPERKLWPHNVGVVTTLFEKVQTKPNGSIVLMCGPEIMMKFSVFSALGAGFAPEQSYVSLERRMKCGVCVCGHCQLGAKFVCQDGPVFPYNEVKRVFGTA